MKHDKARYEARCFLAEEYLLNLKRMKPYKERPICQKFNAGIPVSASEFKNGGLDFFFDVVDQMPEDKAVEYPDFWGNVWHRRVTPLIELTPEQEHLLRDTPEQARIRAIQAELKTYES